jgi:hypothetical protein
VADASLSQPEGIVKDAVYPVASEETLRNLVAEWKATDKSYRNHVQTVICHSYRFLLPQDTAETAGSP